MTQAQRKLEQTARVRSAPPPLPRRNHGGPAVTLSVPSIKPRVSTPPPPPPAAFRNSRPPRVSVPPAPVTEPAMQLALLPQWEDANASLRPAPKKSKSVLYWIGSTTVSIAVGALVAASLMSMRAGDLAQILPNLHSDSARVSAPQAPQAPVQIAEPAHVLELQTAVAAATQQPVVIDELTVTSAARAKASKPNKRAKLAARAAARTATLSSAQPDPREEVAAESVSEAETTPVAPATEAPAATVAAEPTTDTTEVVAAAEPTPAAPEVSEPEAPALPDKLTRDQVRAGLDAMRSQVLQCANGTYGRVLADVTISAPGRVSHAVIEGTFAGTNAGSCMARALRNAKFPAFAGQDISVRYPYSF